MENKETKLVQYEQTGLSPEQVIDMQADCEEMSNVNLVIFTENTLLRSKLRKREKQLRCIKTLSKTAKNYIYKTCNKYGITNINNEMPVDDAIYLIEQALKAKGLDDYEIRQEFSSDMELLAL